MKRHNRPVVVSNLLKRQVKLVSQLANTQNILMQTAIMDEDKVPSNIDPVLFGALTQQVEQLEKQVTALQADVRELLELANKSKGGIWAGMAVASFVGGVVSWIASHMKIG